MDVKDRAERLLFGAASAAALFAAGAAIGRLYGWLAQRDERDGLRGR